MTVETFPIHTFKYVVHKHILDSFGVVLFHFQGPFSSTPHEAKVLGMFFLQPLQSGGRYVKIISSCVFNISLLLYQEIDHRRRAAWACIRRFSRELFDRPRAPWRLKVRLLRAEAMAALLYGCMTWAPRREHYRLLRRTHHRLLLRVIGYRRERGTYRQLSYAQALKKTGCQSMEATIRQRRYLFAGAMARQPAGRLPKRLMDGKLVGGEDPGKGRPEQNWMDCLKDDFQAFGATDGSTVDSRLTFEVDRAVWTLAAKMDDGAPWHKGVLQGAEKFMASWHKEEEKASRRRATNRNSRDLEPPTHL